MVLACMLYQMHVGREASVTDQTDFGKLVAISMSFLSHKP